MDEKILVYRSGQETLYHILGCLLWKPNLSELYCCYFSKVDIVFGCDTKECCKYCIGMKISKKEKHFASVIKHNNRFHLSECPVVKENKNKEIYQFRFSSFVISHTVDCCYCEIQFPIIANELLICDELVDLGCQSSHALEYARFCYQYGYTDPIVNLLKSGRSSFVKLYRLYYFCFAFLEHDDHTRIVHKMIVWIGIQMNYMSSNFVEKIANDDIYFETFLSLSRRHNDPERFDSFYTLVKAGRLFKLYDVEEIEYKKSESCRYRKPKSNRQCEIGF